MAILKIHTDKDPILRKKSQQVENINKEIKKLINDMQSTLRVNRGVGLAAPQVGILQRIIILEYLPINPQYKISEKIPFMVIINPIIYWKSKKNCKIEEGCLSLPDIRDFVERPEMIKIKGQDEKGKKLDFTAKGFKARIIQHEVDHLDGILFIDYLKNQ